MSQVQKSRHPPPRLDGLGETSVGIPRHLGQWPFGMLRGCLQAAELMLFDENDIRNGLPKKVWQQKVLVWQDYIRRGGSVNDVTSVGTSASLCASCCKQTSHQTKPKRTTTSFTRVSEDTCLQQLTKPWCHFWSPSWGALWQDRAKHPMGRMSLLIVMAGSLRTFSTTCG